MTRKLLLFVYGFILAFLLVLAIQFLLCERCINTQRTDSFTWYVRSGIEKVVPLRRNASHISATFDITGLGNLMFQYASLIGIARESNMEPVVPLDCKLNGIFQMDVAKCNSSRPGLEWGKVLEHRASTFDPVLSKLYIDENVELVGYLQSWMYFKNIQIEIRRHFTFKQEIETKVDEFYTLQKQRIFRNNKNKNNNNTIYIGVHIRRGDMFRKDHLDYGYTVADNNYLKTAVLFYENKFPNKTLVFVVCSDDLIWAKAHFPLPKISRHYYVIFCSGDADDVDLATLRRCNNTVITTGTFSWWAGWLAGGHVTYFNGYPRNNSRLQRSFSSHKRDYYMPGWTGL